MTSVREPGREAAIGRVRAVVDHRLRDGTVVARSNGAADARHVVVDP